MGQPIFDSLRAFIDKYPEEFAPEPGPGAAEKLINYNSIYPIIPVIEDEYALNS